MKRISILGGTLLFFILNLDAYSAVREYSDSDVTQMIANAPTAEKFPQAGAAVLLHQKTTQYNADHSAVSDEHLVVKILQDRGKDSFGDIKRKYNKDSDSIVVVKAVTFLKDGSVMPVETKAINDITPADLANASIYSNIMEKVISFPAIAPGVTIELKLRTYSKAPEKNEEFFVWGGDLFQQNDPIVHKELSLIVPQGVDIKYTFQNEGLDYTTSTDKGMVTHTWKIDNAAQIIPEPSMPRLIKVAPRLIYTNMTSWEKIGSWFAGKFYPHVKTDGEIAKKVAELTKSSKTSDEKTKALCLYVMRDIRGIGETSLPLGLAGYEPHDADVVLANKYGDWRDKTVLLVSLLKAANIECDPVFVHLSAPPLASEYPSLKQFNAIFVYVPSYLGKPLWVDSFADNCFFGYLADAQGGTGLEVAPDKSELLPIIETKPEENQSLCRFDVKVRPNGDVDGKFACQLTGMFDAEARSRLKDATPKEVEQYFLTSANAVGEGSKSTSYKKTNLDNLLEPVQIAQSFLTPELGVVQGDMMILRTPEVPFDFARLPSSPSQSQRNYNYVLENEISVKTEGMFTLPKGYKAVFVSNPIKIENQFGTWQSAFKLSPDSSTVQYNSSVTLVDKTIDTDEYQQFKKAFDDFVSPKNTMILLEKQLSQ